MKYLSYFGLVIFYIGIILFFIYQIKPEYFEFIDEFYLNIMWPIGLLIYGLAKAADEKNKTESLNN